MTLADTRARRRERIDTWALAGLTLLCTTYAFPRWADWNQSSRFDLTVAIVDHHTLSIDCCVSNTGDYAIFDGRTYSDKAPGLSFLAVPPYLLWRTVSGFGLAPAVDRLAHGEAVQGTLRPEGSGLLPEKIAFAAGLTLATFLAVALPAALANAILFRFLARFSLRRFDRLAVTLTAALATIAFPYAGAFYAHQLVAALLFVAFALAHSLPEAHTPRLRLIGIGLLLGYAVISEYPAALIVAVILGYVAYQVRVAAQLKGTDAAWVLIGFFPPLLLAASYHWSIFQTPLPVAYRYSALWHDRHSVGLVSISIPRLDALWGLTFSPYRGLFFTCPVLLLSLVGIGELARSARRAEAWVSVAAVGSFFLFNSASVMWWGGRAVGPRYLVPMLPFLAWPLIAFLDRRGSQRWRWPLFAALAIVSLLQVWSLTYAGQHFPEETWRFPLRDYAWPELVRGNLARNLGTVVGLPGWWSLAPLGCACVVLGGLWRLATRR